MQLRFQTIKFLAKETARQFSRDRVSLISAAISFYTIISLAPLLLVMVSLIGWLLGQEAAQKQILEFAQQYVGPSASELVQEILAEQGKSASKVGFIPFLGAVLTFFAATRVFSQLQEGLNLVWGVRPKKLKKIKGTARILIRKRLFSFVVLLAIGLSWFASIVFKTGVQILSEETANFLPAPPDIVWQIGEYLISTLILTGLFMLIFRILPDAKIAWSDVWVGAAGTAILSTLGMLFLSIYLGRQGTTSAYGAAGSLMVILLWVYYSSIVFLTGAEFTQAYATFYGRGVSPEVYAECIYPRSEPAPQP